MAWLTVVAGIDALEYPGNWVEVQLVESFNDRAGQVLNQRSGYWHLYYSFPKIAVPESSTLVFHQEAPAPFVAM